MKRFPFPGEAKEIRCTTDAWHEARALDCEQRKESYQEVFDAGSKSLAMPWRSRSPHTIMPTPKWQPCLSKGLSLGTTRTAPPTSTWPSCGLNHPRQRGAGA